MEHESSSPVVATPRALPNAAAAVAIAIFAFDSVAPVEAFQPIIACWI
jgi:hypothetical protein